MEFIEIIKLTLFLFIILISSLVIISYSVFKIKNRIKNKPAFQNNEKVMVQEIVKRPEPIKMIKVKPAGFIQVQTSSKKKEKVQPPEMVKQGFSIYNHYSQNKSEQLHKLRIS